MYKFAVLVLVEERTSLITRKIEKIKVVSTVRASNPTLIKQRWALLRKRGNDTQAPIAMRMHHVRYQWIFRNQMNPRWVHRKRLTQGSANVTNERRDVLARLKRPKNEPDPHDPIADRLSFGKNGTAMIKQFLHFFSFCLVVHWTTTGGT